MREGGQRLAHAEQARAGSQQRNQQRGEGDMPDLEHPQQRNEGQYRQRNSRLDQFGTHPEHQQRGRQRQQGSCRRHHQSPGLRRSFFLAPWRVLLSSRLRFAALCGRVGIRFLGLCATLRISAHNRSRQS